MSILQLHGMLIRRRITTDDAMMGLLSSPCRIRIILLLPEAYSVDVFNFGEWSGGGALYVQESGVTSIIHQMLPKYVSGSISTQMCNNCCNYTSYQHLSLFYYRMLISLPNNLTLIQSSVTSTTFFGDVCFARYMVLHSPKPNFPFICNCTGFQVSLIGSPLPGATCTCASADPDPVYASIPRSRNWKGAAISSSPIVREAIRSEKPAQELALLGRHLRRRREE